MPGREYRLTVEGELSDCVGAAFEGMTLTRGEGTTELVGHVVDQAQLQGLLQRISDLGLTLLSATATDAGGLGAAAQRNDDGGDG
jgi:hypothetical protein